MDRYGEDGTPFSGKIGPVGMVSVTTFVNSLSKEILKIW